MENNQRKKLVCVLTCAVVVIETLIIGGFLVSDIGSSDSSIQETNTIMIGAVDSRSTEPLVHPTYAMWIGFNVTGTIEVIVPDTNAGETPDQAWEEAEKILSKYTKLNDVKLERVFTGTMVYDSIPNEPTKTDKNAYSVTVCGIVNEYNTEQAIEHFWEDICSGVGGEWCVVELKD